MLYSIGCNPPNLFVLFVTRLDPIFLVAILEVVGLSYVLVILGLCPVFLIAILDVVRILGINKPLL